MLERVGSPAEAYFIRALFKSPATITANARAYCRGVGVQLQVPVRQYFVDVVASDAVTQLAIEIDGAHHWSTREQIAADYFRERRLLRAGYVVIRFTASEVMRDPAGAWRDVFAVLAVRGVKTRSA